MSIPLKHSLAGYLVTESGEKVQVKLAISNQQQTKGLSGVQAGKLKDNQGMLFVYEKEAPRSFWMPDTYFDLDIFFLNKDLKIVHIARNVSHHPGRIEPPAIARTKAIKCQYVLELASTSPLSKKIKLGQNLKWLGSQSLFEIISKIHPLQ